MSDEPLWRQQATYGSHPERPGLRVKESLGWDPLPLMEEHLEEEELTGKSKSHLRNVRTSLLHLSRYLRDTTDVLHPGEITRLHLLRFHSHLMTQGYSQSYIHMIMKFVRRWLDWLVENGHQDQSPYHHIKVKEPKKKPHPIETEDLEQLFSAHRQQAFSVTPFTFHRREVMLALLYGWGLRAAEALALNVSQMDMRLEFVRVTSAKSGDIKTLPYTKALKQAIQRWLVVRARHAQVGEDALLISKSGTRWNHSGLAQSLTELGQRAGVTITPHRLRDTLGTHLLDQDVPIERVMAILGHRNAATTLAYARVNNEPVRREYERAMGEHLHGLLFKRTTPPGKMPAVDPSTLDGINVPF